MPRKILPDALWAANLNYSAGVAIGTPTRVEPSAGEQADGFLPGQVSAQKANWALGVATRVLDYINAIEVANIQKCAPEIATGVVGLGYDSVLKCHWATAHDFTDFSVPPALHIYRSFSNGDDWKEIANTGDFALLSFWTGGFAMSTNGDFCALGAAATAGFPSSIVVFRDNTAGIGLTSIAEVDMVGANYTHAGVVRWVPDAGVFLWGGKSSAPSSRLYSIPPNIAVVSVSVHTPTTPRTGGTPISLIAVGDDIVLAADTDGYMWSAPADLSTAFTTIGAGTVRRSGIIALEWLPYTKLFMAAVWSTGTPFPAGLSFWTSADGSVWTLTTTNEAFVQNVATGTSDMLGGGGVPSGQPFYKSIMAVQGTTIVVLLQATIAAGSAHRLIGYSTDVGATWKTVPVPLRDVPADGVGGSEFNMARLHKHPSEDRIYLTIGRGLNTGGSDPLTNFAAGLRLT